MSENNTVEGTSVELGWGEEWAAGDLFRDLPAYDEVIGKGSFVVFDPATPDVLRVGTMYLADDAGWDETPMIVLAESKRDELDAKVLVGWRWDREVQYRFATLDDMAHVESIGEDGEVVETDMTPYIAGAKLCSKGHGATTVSRDGLRRDCNTCKNEASREYNARKAGKGKTAGKAARPAAPRPAA